MKITIQGAPVPKHSLRYYTRRGIVYFYNDQKKTRDSIKKEMIYEFGKFINSDNKNKVIQASSLSRSDVFSVRIVFHMPIPKSWSKYKKFMAVLGVEVPNKKPDVDNMEKFILDCANRILFEDDRMITQLSSLKMYSKNPRTVLEVLPVKKLKVSEKQKQILTLYSLEDIQDLKYLVEKIEEQTHGDRTQGKIDSITKNIEIMAKDNCNKLKKIVEFSKIKSIRGGICLS